MSCEKSLPAVLDVSCIYVQLSFAAFFSLGRRPLSRSHDMAFSEASQKTYRSLEGSSKWLGMRHLGNLTSLNITNDCFQSSQIFSYSLGKGVSQPHLRSSGVMFSLRGSTILWISLPPNETGATAPIGSNIELITATTPLLVKGRSGNLTSIRNWSKRGSHTTPSVRWALDSEASREWKPSALSEGGNEAKTSGLFDRNLWSLILCLPRIWVASDIVAIDHIERFHWLS